MNAGTRKPSWKEKDKNMRRERIRRAIAANIYAGLRKYGNYNLPRHCDNNQVLKALCDEAGWTVEPDGTTYRKGCKSLKSMEVEVTIASMSSGSPYTSSYEPSPFTSYNPSPSSSSLASPSSSSYNITNTNKHIPDANSLIPWLKNLSSNPISSSSSSKPPRPNHLFVNMGSVSAPVTPPTSSPRFNAKIDPSFNWRPQYDYACPSFVSSSPSSPTFSLVSPSSGMFRLLNSGMASEGSSRMWTPSQSGICSPVMSNACRPGDGDVRVKSDEFAFGMLKAWEGERIHEECGDDLELTLGTSNTRADHA